MCAKVRCAQMSHADVIAPVPAPRVRRSGQRGGAHQHDPRLHIRRHRCAHPYPHTHTHTCRAVPHVTQRHNTAQRFADGHTRCLTLAVPQASAMRACTCATACRTRWRAWCATSAPTATTCPTRSSRTEVRAVRYKGCVPLFGRVLVFVALRCAVLGCASYRVCMRACLTVASLGDYARPGRLPVDGVCQRGAPPPRGTPDGRRGGQAQKGRRRGQGAR